MHWPAVELQGRLVLREPRGVHELLLPLIGAVADTKRVLARLTHHDLKLVESLHETTC